ncbi:MAG: redoxin domain-containing protein [Planctomyces sp.]
MRFRCVNFILLIVLTVVLVPAAPSAAAEQSPDSRSARLLKPAEHGVGQFIADLEFQDLQGRMLRLSDFRQSKALVIAMTSTSCPLSRKYLPTLTAMAQQYGQRSVQFVLVNSIRTDDRQAMQTAAAGLPAGVPYIVDADEALLRRLQVVSTTDVLILDPARTVLYHGAVDDQYGVGYALDQPKRRFLADALEAVLAGRTPATAATTAPGCVLEADAAVAEPTAVTWHNRISRILQQRCMECHRSGGVAPFALQTVAEASAHAGMIKQVVSDRTMPPWFAANAPQHTVWANDRSLTEAERRDLLAWLDGGRPEGHPEDAPQTKEWPAEWSQGPPDEIVQLPQPIRVKATGKMAYQYVNVTWTGQQDRWVRGYEIQPTDRGVVHHVIVNVLEPGQQSSRREEGVGGYWAAYVPGNSGQMYPAGFARRLPAGATFRFQIHYTPNGTATSDQLRVGLYFADSEPKYEVSTIPLARVNLSIPPHAANHVETLTRPVPMDIPVLAYMAHMHVRGKAFRFELQDPDGVRSTLLDLPKYDFNWQLRYDLQEPQVLKQGSKVILTAVYDNSADNPANPDPSRTVRWGDQTDEEMMIGYVETYAAPGERRGRSGGRAAASATSSAQVLFSLLDQDGNGLLDTAELERVGERFPGLKSENGLLERVFREADGDSDGKLSLPEFEAARDQIRRR